MLPRDEHTQLSLALVDSTLQGCRLMSNLSSLLREMVAFKCSHACPDELLMQRTRGADIQSVCDYERALRYNLDGLERSALVEVLAMLKGLQSTLRAVCGDLEDLIHRGVHELTQHFVHETMGGPTRKAVKYEKKLLKTQLLQLRNLCADWAGYVADLMDEKKMMSKEFKFASHAGDYPPRSTPPSQTQLWLMRATTRALFDDRSPYTKGSFGKDPDLSKETVKEMKDFVSKSAYFPHLLRLSSTLDDLGDVACLWMREFYLELCKRVQFPISMSLPAILTEHVLAAGNSHLMPMLLFAFDAYSDGARLALRQHEQQHLFIEIEAEANLLFDQVLYSLSEQIFAHFKARAASSLLAELGRSSADGEDAEANRALGKCWYLPLLSVRHARILGRSVDLARLIIQRMNAMVRQSLDLALSRFESKSLDAVIDLHRSIRVTRLTHGYLREALPEIDDFDACLSEVGDSVAFLSFHSRILTHTLTECLSDLFPNFAYRTEGAMFQRPQATDFTQPPERDGAPRAAGAHLLYGTREMNQEYQLHAARASGFFSVAHAEALVSVLGEGGVQSLLSTLHQHVEAILRNDMDPYVNAVQNALPEGMKMPSHKYGAKGCFLFFDAKLKDLANYEELHSGVFQSFRRLGNCLALLTLLESAVHSNATAALHQIPRRGAPQPIAVAAKAIAAAWGQAPQDSDLVLMAEQASSLSAPLASSSSLITRALINATNVVSTLSESWLAGETEGSDLGSHEETKAFHRVWSAVSFLYATAPYEMDGRGTFDNAMLFGDGVVLAGSFLLHALCQRHRFDLLGYNPYVFGVYVADAGSVADPVMDQFIHRVSLMKKGHDHFSAMLDARDAPTIYNVWRRV
jgi:cytoplasmic FMR1 interacting protein